MKNFSIRAGEYVAGFKIKIADNVILSITNSFGSYTDVRDHKCKKVNDYFEKESNLVEVAIMDNEGNFTTQDFFNINDDVIGEVDPLDLISIINQAQKKSLQ